MGNESRSLAREPSKKAEKKRIINGDTPRNLLEI